MTRPSLYCALFPFTTLFRSFRAHADYVVKIIAIPIQILHTLMWPLIVISNGASNLLVRLLKVGQERSEKGLRRQEVETTFRELMERGGRAAIDQADAAVRRH